MTDLERLGALLHAMPELQAAYRRERERAVDELRALVPGVEGRLDGTRFYVTEAEAALIRERVPLIARTVDAPDAATLAALDIVIEERP